MCGGVYDSMMVLPFFAIDKKIDEENHYKWPLNDLEINLVFVGMKLVHWVDQNLRQETTRNL